MGFDFAGCFFPGSLLPAPGWFTLIYPDAPTGEHCSAPNPDRQLGKAGAGLTTAKYSLEMAELPFLPPGMLSKATSHIQPGSAELMLDRLHGREWKETFVQRFILIKQNIAAALIYSGRYTVRAEMYRQIYRTLTQFIYRLFHSISSHSNWNGKFHV